MNQVQNIAARRNPSSKKNLKKNKAVNITSKRMPNIVLIGSERLRKSLIDLERKFSIFIKCTTFSDLEHAINHLSLTIIIDENIIKNDPKHITSEIKTHYPYIKLIYLARSKQRDFFYEKLYQSGVDAIIKWPQEKEIIAELVLESLKPHPKATGLRNKDEKLSHMIKTHILLNNGPKNIKVFTVEGFVFLTGKVKNLWEIKEIREIVSCVLGVKKVISKDLQVSASKKTTNKEIERVVKIFISHLLGKQKRSFGVRLKNKTATITGNIPSKISLNIVKKFLMKQPTINIIIDNSKVDDQAAIKKSNLIKNLEKKVTILFDGVKRISIRILANTLEISGTVELSVTKRLIEDYLVQKLPVNKVINKVIVISNT